jgi:hypothetical protein
MGIGIFEIIILSGIGLVAIVFLAWAVSLIFKSNKPRKDKDS